MKRLLLATACLTACFDPSDAPSCTIACLTDSDCPGNLTCSPARTCTAGEDCTMPSSCTPDEFIACVNGAARTCNAAGDGTVDAACGDPGCNADAQRCNACVPDELSCTTDMTQLQQCQPDGSAVTPIESCVSGCLAATASFSAHCAYIAPEWMANICDDKATVDLFMPNAAASYDTNLDTNCTGGVFTQPTGRPICIVRAKAITIGVALTITGTRPIAFVADDMLTVSGNIDVSANHSASGAGGGQRTSGSAPASEVDGGGGAGFGSVGANGGGTTGTGGAIFDPLSLNYFAGGAKAYQPPVNQLNVPSGGGGGGALMLVSCRGTVLVTVNGVLEAAGGGGEAASDTTAGSVITFSNGAGGGGSGGYVVMQGLHVTVNGTIYANGGGGGGGCSVNDSAGGVGGNATSIGGTGGAATGTAAGAGGRGASKTAAAVNGSAGTTSSGGGGGGMGVLQIYTPMGVNPLTTNATTSPAFASNKTVPLR